MLEKNFEKKFLKRKFLKKNFEKKFREKLIALEKPW